MTNFNSLVLPSTLKLESGNNANAFYDIHPGPLGNYQVIFTNDDVNRWARIYEDRFPWAPNENSILSNVAPASIFYYPSMNALKPIRYFGEKPNDPNPQVSGPGGLARMWMELHGPIPIGKKIDIDAKVTDKYQRRGIGYTEWGLDAYIDGELIHKHRKSWATTVSKEELVKWPEKASSPRPPEMNENSKILGTLEYVTSQEHVDDLEGPGEINNHTDVQAALANGDPAPRAQGALAFGLLSRLMCEEIGDKFYLSGTLDIKFVNNVFAGDTQKAKGAFIEKNEDNINIYRVWTENQSGALTAIGTATVKD
ncbi:MAG: MaoC family dehydratase [Dehalococcoidia bacterium]|jgi:hypothetical protein|nr:MAG: hypothetical protein DK305_000063 [Chloroflexota bacterium]|tara:strand:- start:16469 stop:17401 length:933 start_codon:yes stop_codon:yes gene_type:complete